MQLVASGAGSLADDNVQSEIFHGRVKDLLHSGVKAVDLIDKKIFLRLQICKNG